MINMKKLMMVASLLLLIGGIGGVATFYSLDLSPFEETVEVPAADVESIDVRLKNGSVYLKETSDDQIRVELSGKGRNIEDEQLHVSESEGTLLIETISKRKALFDMFSGVYQLSLTVYIPDKVYDSLQIDLNNGLLDVEQLSVNHMQATARNTNIRLEHMAADVIRLETKNGSISLDDVAGDIVGETNNGSISIITEHLDRHIDLQTSNGNITIRTDKEPTNATLDIRTSNGKINVFDQANWDIVSGSGEYEIRLRTSNGKVTISH